MWTSTTALMTACWPRPLKDEHTLFLNAVKRHRRHSFVCREFLTRDADFEVNISGRARTLALAGDYGPATGEVQSLLTQNRLLPGNARRLI